MHRARTTGAEDPHGDTDWRVRPKVQVRRIRYLDIVRPIEAKRLTNLSGRERGAIYQGAVVAVLHVVCVPLGGPPANESRWKGRAGLLKRRQGSGLVLVTNGNQ